MAKRVRRFVECICFITGCISLCLLLLAFLAVQYQQWMLRWRSERLVADMRRINPSQSTWVDAQQLMHRWGVWGHYDGSCTAVSCKYEIRIVNSSFYDPHVKRNVWLDWPIQHDYFDLYEWLGGRSVELYGSFLVNDGIIRKKNISLGYTIPLKKIRVDGEYELTLIINVVGLQQRDETIGEFGILNSDGELSRYPYYKAMSRGGITNGEMRYVYYNDHTPPDIVMQLTSFDFSCFTRLNPCTEFGQLLPAVKEWNP